MRRLSALLAPFALCLGLPAQAEPRLPAVDCIAEAFVDDPGPVYVNGQYDNASPIADDSGDGYAYGWSVTKGEQDYATHTGSWMGTSTLVARNLTTGVTVILLANGEAADLWAVQGDIEAAID